MSPGFKDPTTEMPAPPSDHIPLGGVVRFEGPNLSEWVSGFAELMFQKSTSRHKGESTDSITAPFGVYR
jgi:hypothetical protein